jgi:C4-dicarboxylate-specific signal transduction histidine kinase
MGAGTTSTHSPKAHRTLRRLLLGRVLLVAGLHLVLTLAIVKFQLYPQVERLQIELNAALAGSVARNTRGALERPMVAVQAAVKQLSLGSSPIGAAVQGAIAQLVDSNEAAESAYLLNSRGRVVAVAHAAHVVAGSSGAAGSDRMGLDLSQSEAFRAPEKNRVRISPIFLSAVSDRPMIAVTGPLADGGLLVMELSLSRLTQNDAASSVSEGMQVLIVDSSGQVVADQDGQRARQSAMLPVEAMRQLGAERAATIRIDDQNVFASASPIAIGALDWRVIVMRPQSWVYGPINSIAIWTLTTSGVLLLLTIAILMWVTRRVARSTELLRDHARGFEAGEVPAPRDLGVKELADVDASLRAMAHTLTQRESLLRQANDVLERRVQERTQHLQASNSELEQAMLRLENTQAELVQAGKMAALGSMVAGVAHELNTPVGIARLAATTVVHSVEQFRLMVEGGKLTRSALAEHLAQTEEGALLIDRSLERAAGIVQAFKQVAVDQSSNRRRQFDLRQVIAENQLLLSPRLNQAKAQLTVRIDRPVEMVSYPGDLGQVLTNLIENVLVHGYADRDGGAIDIVVTQPDEDSVRIAVRDFGQGIPPDSLSRVFDPFFTTRLGQGGSGLGLSIAYSMVTRTLAGKITVESVHGQGATFTLDLPTHAPEHPLSNP